MSPARSFYRVEADAEGKEFVFPDVADTHVFFRMFNGQPLANVWKPIELKVISVGDHGEALSGTDNYYLAAHLLAFDVAAVGVLRAMLEDAGELLPVECVNRSITLFNCTCLLDAVDEAASDIARFSDGRILAFRRLILDASKCSGHDIFRLSQNPFGGVYVSEAVRTRVENAGLSGFSFLSIESNVSSET